MSTAGLRQISNFKDGIRGTHDKDLMGLTMRLSVMNLNDKQKRSLSSKISLMKSKKIEQSIQGDLVTGEFVFQHCISCHGESAEGDATISAPKLTGQNDWYIYRQLINFQKGIRGQHPEDLYGRQMMEMAEMFNEEMLARAKNRTHVRGLWGIGKKFSETSSSAVEAKMGSGFSGGFKFGVNKRPWTDKSLMLEISKAIVDTLRDLREIDRDCKATGGERGGGWLRYHLENANEEETT